MLIRSGFVRGFGRSAGQGLRPSALQRIVDGIRESHLLNGNESAKLRLGSSSEAASVENRLT
jgi:hypothetical protein